MPDVPVQALPVGWNDTATDYERDASIHDVWLQRLAETPDAVAIADARRALTYRQLDAAAARLARRFDRHLQGSEPCVGVLADRCVEAVVAFLAILKAGGAYVPLDPAFPRERLAFMVEDTGARVIVAAAPYLDQARDLAPVTVPLEPADAPADHPIDGDDAAGFRPAPTGPHSLVYVMYTSGTSGRPKGVAIEHRGVLRYARGAKELLPRAGEGMLFVNQLGFDGSTYEIWGALLNGARLVVHDGPPRPVEIARTVLDVGATVSMLPTGLFHQLVDWARSRQGGAESVAHALSGMRLVLPAGDVLSPSHARGFLDLAPGCRLVNAYGPTETTVTGSIYHVADPPDDESVPIGRPLPNTTLYVLDPDGRQVPAGETGELYIGGDGVARGYLNRPDLTAERFVPDPFAGTEGARLYRTGDLVRLRPDGELEFFGRIDNQVKIRGYRVEPGEIESVLNTHAAVRQAVVVAREDVPGHKRLVAYATVAGDVSGEDLRRHSAERLPDYAVPSAFVVVDEFALTVNGKIDRAALPRPAAGHGAVAPRTRTEGHVADAIEAVLQCGPVGVDDDFFDLGGDSLLAIQVLSRLYDSLGVTPQLEALFSARTVAGVAAHVQALLDTDTRATRLAPLPDALAVEPAAPEPASMSQALACFHSELADSALPYQSQAVIRFDGRLDPQLLERALNAVVARHEILRTTFPKQHGTWVQQVHPAAHVTLPVADLRAAADPDAAFERLREERFSRRIELSRLPLVQWTLARLGDDRWALIQVEHHVVHDGWSFALVLGELTSAYRALQGGRDDPLPPPGVQYRQFARWQREFPTTEAGRRQLDYWTARLADLPPAPELPQDRPRPRVQSYRGGSVSRELPPELEAAIRRTASELGATPFMVMLTAFYALLHRYSGQRDLVVGSGLAGRRLPGLDELIGMVVNTVALRVAVDGDRGARTLLEAVRSCCLQAQDNQELPFEQVVQRIAPQRHGGQAQIYRHLFSFHDSPMPALDLDGVAVTAFDTLSNGSAKADVNVIVVNRRTSTDPGSGALTVVWEYAGDLFDAATAERMLAQYVRLLEALVADPDRPVAQLPLTVPAERAALIAASRNPQPYERDATICQVFAQRVAERPDAVAVTAGSDALSYAQLDAAADVIAHRLRDCGVTAGECVAVVDDRSPAMIAALLAVLRVGGAYVGIDTALPAARVAALLAAAGVRVACSEDGAAVAGAAVTVATGRLAADPVPGAPLPEPVPTTASDLAYVSFTSGSTGEPKGVAVTQRGVIRLVRGADYVRLDADETLLAAAPLSFDASTFEIWGALLNGARLVLAPQGPMSTAEIAALLGEQRVTTAWFTAAIFHRMVDHELDALCRLRQVLAGGDVLSPAHVNRLLAALPPQSVLVNGYGPTEATTFTCCHVLRAGTSVAGPVPIGRPIANSAAYVVDAAGEPVPAGLLGELWAGGDGVARGYLGRADLTEQRFGPDPFADEAGAQVYRTGDLARLRADGSIEFAGRSDRQVKLRGFRVEPAEVEAALVRLPGVRQAYVDAADHGRDDRRLIAYLVGDGSPSDAEVRRELALHLPRYLVPSAYVWLDRFPVTSSGKLDRAALPAPPSTWFDERAGAVSPESTIEATPAGIGKTERALLAIWQEVTGVRRVGLDDDFFDLGGHSLLAVELFAAIERTIGARLPLSTIFSAPTVRQLAEVLRSEGWDAPWGSLVALQSAGTRPPLFAVTAGDGNVVGFGPLARRLGGDQPFYVLQPHGLDGKALLHRTVTSMARRYVREIRAVQPHGPYLLAGRCFGALVAVAMTHLLEAAGEQVALLAAIDSVGPFWAPRRLANGLPYDEVMNLARARALAEGNDLGDVFGDRVAADAFVAWLRAPVTADGPHVVDRYLYAAYQARPDLRAGFPLDAHGHEGLLDWAWIGGRSEMGMNPDLLAAPSARAAAARPSLDPRRTTRGYRAKQRLFDVVDLATRGRVASLAERRRARVLEIATENLLNYRAGAFDARVTLIRSQDDDDDTQKAQLARWFGLQSGGVEVHFVPGTHHGILREPDVAALAECLDACIGRALAADAEEIRPRA